MWDLPNQGLNSCLLHWQMDSLYWATSEALKWHLFNQATLTTWVGFPCSSVGKETVCSAGDLGSIPGSGRFPGGGHGNPIQYSCLENPMNRGAWQAYSPWGAQDLDMTEQLNHHHHPHKLPHRRLSPGILSCLDHVRSGPSLSLCPPPIYPDPTVSTALQPALKHTRGSVKTLLKTLQCSQFTQGRSRCPCRLDNVPMIIHLLEHSPLLTYFTPITVAPQCSLETPSTPTCYPLYWDIPAPDTHMGFHTPP